MYQTNYILPIILFNLLFICCFVQILVMIDRKEKVDLGSIFNHKIKFMKKIITEIWKYTKYNIIFFSLYLNQFLDKFRNKKKF